ncbi:DUF502 domain-containing protein [Oceanobacter mangrovi]|uniref:DUF502 domain-containing protein n=1 Tax=Oceanobacter mangrovi TaxID=2862510 RepID=UPI001C8D8AC7|nr:DUF502 domain-containing protein [Oceanobacter mangrovi]
MPYLARVLLKGSIVVLPLAVTIWFLWSTILWLDESGLMLLDWFGIQFFDGQSEIPGIGLAFTILGLFLVGLLFQFDPVSWLYEYLEGTLMRFPVVKTLYGAVKDFAAMFDNQQKKHQPVVLVNLPQQGTLVGFITSEKMPEAVANARPGEELVAVYLPMSYMVGGYTVFLPSHCLTPVAWSFEEAMRFAITAGVSQNGQKMATKTKSEE